MAVYRPLFTMTSDKDDNKDSTTSKLAHPDNVAVICILTFWFFVLDIGVVMVDKSDAHAAEYLTNQTWMLCLLAKVLLTVEFFTHLDRANSSESVTLRGWWTTTLWLIVGAMQFGVLGAFFLLTYLDSTLLDDMLENHEHTLAEIMIWNHARHVTVCFLHIAITWSLRHYLSANTKGEHACLCDTVTANYRLFCWMLIVLPSALGMIHWLIFDDQKLYKYGSKEIGSKCQGAFALFAFLSALYYIFVPLRSVELEHTNPEILAHAAWNVIPDAPEEDYGKNDEFYDNNGNPIAPPPYQAARFGASGRRSHPPLRCIHCTGPILM